ncbi:CBS domain-containing protein [Neobacillus dielmonensis]|uniref:CBS domain-containing protein n=1 Tax=Neobacillus dielmonensis TaxID=1347369 RepID=UPI0005A91732|nr:CBS domain-containing protein [Neobacillus dielmonensis]
MQVRDFMIRNIITVKNTTTVKELISILETNRIGGVPVVDDKGNLVGVVSDGDIVRFLSPNKEKVYLAYYVTYIEEAQKIEDVLRERMNTPVEKIMVRKNIKTLAPDDDFESAIRLISKHHFKKIPVVNGAGRVIGIISRGDIIHTLSKTIFNEDTGIGVSGGISM